MSKIVIKLQEDCISSAIKPSDLLRTAKLIASKLNLHSITDWINKELDGYAVNDTIPNYRRALSELTAFNPHTRHWMPCIIPHEEYEKIIRTVEIMVPIAEVEKFAELSAKDGSLEVILPGTKLRILQDLFKSNLNFRSVISNTIMNKIADSVRNNILDWAISLEKQGIMGEGLLFTDQEKKQASDNPVINNIINSVVNGNVIGQCENSTFKQHLSISVSKGNRQELIDALKECGIEPNDISSLTEAIDHDSLPIEKGNFGNKVNGWIGSMVTKALSGGLAISGSVACNVLTSIIAQYLGSG